MFASAHGQITHWGVIAWANGLMEDPLDVWFVMPCLLTIFGESKNRKELFKLSTTSFPVTESRMGSEGKSRMSQDMLNFSNWDSCPLSNYSLLFVVFFLDPHFSDR